MVVIMVHWLIRPGYEKKFEDRWKQMSVDVGSGLYREILTTLDTSTSDDQKFHTFSLGDPFYRTYINIGMWESLESFDAAIGKYIPPIQPIQKEDGRFRYSVEIDEFEFKLRERAVLKVVSDRGGSLPAAAMPK